MVVGTGMHAINNGLTKISPEQILYAVVNVSTWSTVICQSFRSYYMMKCCNFLTFPQPDATWVCDFFMHFPRVPFDSAQRMSLNLMGFRCQFHVSYEQQQCLQSREIPWAKKPHHILWPLRHIIEDSTWQWYKMVGLQRGPRSLHLSVWDQNMSTVDASDRWNISCYQTPL